MKRNLSNFDQTDVLHVQTSWKGDTWEVDNSILLDKGLDDERIFNVLEKLFAKYDLYYCSGKEYIFDKAEFEKMLKFLKQKRDYMPTDAKGSHLFPTGLLISVATLIKLLELKTQDETPIETVIYKKMRITM